MKILTTINAKVDFFKHSLLSPRMSITRLMTLSEISGPPVEA